MDLVGYVFVLEDERASIGIPPHLKLKSLSLDRDRRAFSLCLGESPVTCNYLEPVFLAILLDGRCGGLSTIASLLPGIT